MEINTKTAHTSGGSFTATKIGGRVGVSRPFFFSWEQIAQFVNRH